MSIKEKTKIFFFVYVVGGTRSGKWPQFEICGERSPSKLSFAQKILPGETRHLHSRGINITK